MSQTSSQKEAACAPSLFAAFAPLRVAVAEPPRPADRADRAPVLPVQARMVEDESSIDPRASAPEGFRRDCHHDTIFLRRD
jgi:hypothetical protein